MCGLLDRRTYCETVTEIDLPGHADRDFGLLGARRAVTHPTRTCFG